jgi:hypothetical protein
MGSYLRASHPTLEPMGGPVEDEHQIDMDRLSQFPLGLGCAALFCLAGAIALTVVGLFIMWQAADDAKLAEDVAARGRLETAEVTGKDVSRGAVGVSRSGTTQFWLLVARTGEAPPADDGRDARVAVSQAEHEDTAIGDTIEVWRVDDRYVLDRVVSNPTSPVIGYSVLSAGGGAAVVAVVLFLVVVRRVKSIGIGP